MIIKQITAKETHPVRHAVLRKGRPIEDCIFEGDHLETTTHLGAFHDANLVGVATLVCRKDNSIAVLETAPENRCYQLRGMAVLENQQGKHVGKKLLKHAERLLIKMHCQYLWFNARELAVPFYQKQDYEVVSDVFEIVQVGPHYKMVKKL